MSILIIAVSYGEMISGDGGENGIGIYWWEGFEE